MYSKKIGCLFASVLLVGSSCGYAYSNEPLPINATGIEFVVEANSSRSFYIDAKPGETYMVSAYKFGTNEKVKTARVVPPIRKAKTAQEKLFFTFRHEGEIAYGEEAYRIKAERVENNQNFPAYEMDVFVSQKPSDTEIDLVEQRTEEGVVLTNNGKKHISINGITLNDKTSYCFSSTCRYILPGESKVIPYPKGMTVDDAKEAKFRLIDITWQQVNIQKGFLNWFN